MGRPFDARLSVPQQSVLPDISAENALLSRGDAAQRDVPSLMPQRLEGTPLLSRGDAADREAIIGTRLAYPVPGFNLVEIVDTKARP